MKPIKQVSVVLLLSVLSSVTAFGQTAQTPIPPWSDDAIEMFGTLPIQDGGRIKPMDTFAQFTMLKLNGKRWFTTPGGEKLYPVAWLMNCLFYPDVTNGYQHFIVDTSEVIVELGLPAHDKKRDHYSYNELFPARATLFQKGSQYNDIEPAERTRLQKQILNLTHNVMQYEQLIGFFDFARKRFTPNKGSALEAVLNDEGGALITKTLTSLSAVIATLQSERDQMDEATLTAQVESIEKILGEVEVALRFSHALAIIPPESREEREWLSPQGIGHQTFENGWVPPENGVVLLGHLEDLWTYHDDRIAFAAALQALHGGVAVLADARGEYAKVPLEVFYYKKKFMFYSQWLYVLSFILVALSWLAPRSKWMGRIIPAAVALPTVILIIGIVLRCIIRGRPPVSTLYETILFITAVAVVVALIAEYINRQRIAVAMGSFLGAVGMFLAYRFEVSKGEDTMPSLQAVLDTNFWLATHVTTVTMGYAAGLLAAGLAHIYIFGKLFGFKKGNKDFYKSVTRMVYGIVCFCLFFSVLGTVLGGIWANDSWGRFWGWDPKENGALLICLWGLIILHARMGGFIRDMGMATCSVMLGSIVAFSWWGVNELDVGLHAYGSMTGVMTMLKYFWTCESLVIAAGVYASLRERAALEQKGVTAQGA